MTNEGDESSKGSDDSDDIFDSILGDGMPDVMMRSMQDIESAVDQHKAQPAQPKVAAPLAPVAETKAKKEVSQDEAKEAVETAMTAQGLELDSAQKRQVCTPPSLLAMLFALALRSALDLFSCEL